MDMYQRLVNLQLIAQCKNAEMAYRSIQTSLSDIANMDIDYFWYAIQNFLVAAGIVYEILGGKPGDTKILLRNELDIKTDSPLINPEMRDMRNVFEHFSERLLKIALEGSNVNDTFISETDTNGDAIGIEGDNIIHLRRYSITTNSLMYFGGKRIPLTPLHEALAKLRTMAESRQFRF